MPKAARVIETSVYVEDLPRSANFYEGLFGFPRLFADDRLIALDAGGPSVLLLLKRGASTVPMDFPGGVLPPHDGSGQTHFAFGIDRGDVEAWHGELTRRGIAVESHVHWPRGGESLYFRDPDGHLVELATPGVWACY